MKRETKVFYSKHAFQLCVFSYFNIEADISDLLLVQALMWPLKELFGTYGIRLYFFHFLSTTSLQFL